MKVARMAYLHIKFHNRLRQITPRLWPYLHIQTDNRLLRHSRIHPILNWPNHRPGITPKLLRLLRCPRSNPRKSLLDQKAKVKDILDRLREKDFGLKRQFTAFTCEFSLTNFFFCFWTARSSLFSCDIWDSYSSAFSMAISRSSPDRSLRVLRMILICFSTALNSFPSLSFFFPV